MKSDFSNERYYSEKERELAEAKHDGYNSGYDEGYRDGFQECMDTVLETLERHRGMLDESLGKIEERIWR